MRTIKIFLFISLTLLAAITLFASFTDRYGDAQYLQKIKENHNEVSAKVIQKGSSDGEYNIVVEYTFQDLKQKENLIKEYLTEEFFQSISEGDTVSIYLTEPEKTEIIHHDLTSPILLKEDLNKKEMIEKLKDKEEDSILKNNKTVKAKIDSAEKEDWGRYIRVRFKIPGVDYEFYKQIDYYIEGVSPAVSEGDAVEIVYNPSRYSMERELYIRNSRGVHLKDAVDTAEASASPHWIAWTAAAVFFLIGIVTIFRKDVKDAGIYETMEVLFKKQLINTFFVFLLVLPFIGFLYSPYHYINLWQETGTTDEFDYTVLILGSIIGTGFLFLELYLILYLIINYNSKKEILKTLKDALEHPGTNAVKSITLTHMDLRFSPSGVWIETDRKEAHSNSYALKIVFENGLEYSAGQAYEEHLLKIYMQLAEMFPYAVSSDNLDGL
ncbi:MAG: hypothetical protein OEZ34_07820 [Spirochaetia bacterium]|nr:hypothetical protein [Spirochaetia bacterium]